MEILVVPLAYASADPGTVVVEFLNAVVTLAAVRGVLGSHQVAGFAKFVSLQRARQVHFFRFGALRHFLKVCFVLR